MARSTSVDQALQVRLGCGCIEGCAILECHAVPKVKDDRLPAVFVLPALRQVGMQLTGGVTDKQALGVEIVDLAVDADAELPAQPPTQG
jgi:hypothetical protein